MSALVTVPAFVFVFCNSAGLGIRFVRYVTFPNVVLSTWLCYRGALPEGVPGKNTSYYRTRGPYDCWTQEVQVTICQHMTSEEHPTAVRAPAPRLADGVA